MKKLKVLKKRIKRNSNSKFFTKNLKNYLINNYQIYYHFHQKKRSKRLTKHQILENILPLYDSVVISRREHAHKYYAETYDVEVIDNKSLVDSLFLAKKVLMIYLEIY